MDNVHFNTKRKSKKMIFNKIPNHSFVSIILKRGLANAIYLLYSHLFSNLLSFANLVHISLNNSLNYTTFWQIEHANLTNNALILPMAKFPPRMRITQGIIASLDVALQK
jgi:hypothetical protein